MSKSVRTKNTTETQFQANYADNKRNLEGIFWTPFHLCELWPQLVADKFGPDWREKFVVYDPAAGGGNLTANLEIPDLVQSTLEQSDVDYMLANNINPGSVKFAADFLQLELNEIPAAALEKLSATNKEILFVMNPPWKGTGNTSVLGTDAITFKNNKTYKRYQVQQIACLFLLKCIDLANELNKPFHIITYNNQNALQLIERFNTTFYSQVQFNSGRAFSSKEFGLKSNFSCTLTFWSKNATGSRFPFQLLELDNTTPYNLNAPQTQTWKPKQLPRSPVEHPTPYIRSLEVRLTKMPPNQELNKSDLLCVFHRNSTKLFDQVTFVSTLPLDFKSITNSFTIEQFEEALDVFCGLFVQLELASDWRINSKRLEYPTRSESDWLQFRNTTAFHSIVSNNNHIASYREDIHGFNHTNRLCIHGPELVEQHGNDLCRKDMEQNRHIPIAYEWLKSAAFHQSVHDYIDEYNKQLSVVLQQPETRIWDSSWRQLQSRFPDRKRLVQLRDQIREYGRQNAPRHFPFLLT